MCSKTILVPIDFSDVTDRVISAATELARPWKAQLILFHVVQPPATLYSCQLAGAEIAQCVADIEAEAADRLATLAKGVPGARAVSRPATDIPAHEILAVAAENAVDLIVMGSHGHGAFHDLLLGSTTHGVMKRAVCPVLVVPALKAPAPARNTPVEAAMASSS